MSGPPLVNAIVTRLAGGGTSEDYDEPAGTDADRWSGAEPSYLTERATTVIAGGGVDERKLSRLVVPLEIAELARQGDCVTYEQAGTTITRIVREIQRYRIFGTGRLWLDET